MARNRCHFITWSVCKMLNCFFPNSPVLPYILLVYFWWLLCLSHILQTPEICLGSKHVGRCANSDVKWRKEHWAHRYMFRLTTYFGDRDRCAGCPHSHSPFPACQKKPLVSRDQEGCAAALSPSLSLNVIVLGLHPSNAVFLGRN